VAEIAAEIADLPSYGYRRAAAHCDGHLGHCTIAGSEADHDAGVQPADHRDRRELRQHIQARLLAHMDRSSAVAVLAQLLAAFEHFNRVHPHSSLKMMSPREFRQHRRLQASNCA
jgi:transposase InsO family protein